MNGPGTEETHAQGVSESSSATTSLTGSRLIAARVVWLALVIPCLGLFVAGLPLYHDQLQRACDTPEACWVAGALPAEEFQRLASTGVSASGYAALFTMLFAVSLVVWAGVGLLIFWRRADDWFALFVAFFLVFEGAFPLTGGNPVYALTLVHPVLIWPITVLTFVGQVFIYLFILLFPNGQFVPRWAGLILPPAILYAFLANFPSLVSPFNTNWPAWLYLLATLGVVGALSVSHIYRYTRASTPLQRQQTKWVIGGVTVVVVVYVSLIVLSVVYVSENPLLFSGSTLLLNEAWSIGLSVALLLIPLSIGFSILRYRLYDIDVLINRTLVYGSLTATLAAVYFACVVAAQALIRALTGQTKPQPVVIVASTLLIAALFNPLRHRIQAGIDRRFYRQKYDAAKTLEAFGATLRNEVELSQLHDQVLYVVEDTMQPAHVSLWLRPSDRDHETTPHLQP